MELSDPKIGTSVAGRYRLDERLGAGGMGVVYKGEDKDARKTVAVKFLHDAFAGMPDLVKRFEREVAAMSRIDHPNLVSVVDSGVEAGVPYLVMDFQSGKPLAELVERGALPPARAVGLARQILAGVAAAHTSGVVHRDLKPDNIMLLDVDGDFVKIFDFGLAKMVHGSTQATKLTNTGFALGTPAYMSPEQATGAPTDERADIYAIGVMLYHMVTGRVPFDADSPMAVLLKHADETPVPPRKAARNVRITDELEAAILRALEKEPAKRWPSAEAFAGALAATAEGGESQLPPPDVSMQEIGDSKTVLGRRRSADVTSTGRSASPRRALPMRWIVRLTVAAIVGAGLAMSWSRISRRERQHVAQRVDEAVGSAKGILHSLTDPVSQAMRSDPTDGDDSHAAAAPDTPGAKLEAASHASGRRMGMKPRRVRLQDASRLLANGKLDD
ncbi:MAG: Serine/threonine protein kinase PrkC, regulator of stationary phase [bacterium]|nr:Serine/threonine protein kinase PrkC, regulator of stationary phase [bacterium]